MTSTPLNAAVGFHSDVTKLLDRFSAAKDISMAEFTRLWRELSFMKVFLYREPTEIILFMEECFRIVLRLILSKPSHPVAYRVGALFCLYSLYVMQPAEPKVQIRLVPEAWKGLLGLIDTCQLEPWENEVKYAFWDLAYRNAFFFVAKQNSISLVNTFSEEEALGMNSSFVSLIEEYTNTDHKFLQELHDRYMNLKDNLDPSSAKTVQMVDKDLLSTIQANVEALQAKFCPRNAATVQRKPPSDSDDGWSEPSESEDEDNTLERRRKLRAKHQVARVQQSKSRRHRNVEAPQKEPTPKSPRGRAKKGSPGRGRKRKSNVESRPFKGVSMETEEQS